MKQIMNQRANMSADLAAVLTIQEEHGIKMIESQEEWNKKANDWMDKRWKSINDMADAAAAKEKVADSIQWLEHQERSLNIQLNMKHNKTEANQKRLLAAREGITTRLRKVRYAVRKADELRATQEGRNEEAIETPATELTATDVTATVPNYDVRRTVLPRHLKKPLPTPYTLEGVSIRWADLQDAMYAKDQWPALIEHEPLDLHATRRGISLLSAEEFEIEKRNEVGRVIEQLYHSQETSQSGPESSAPL